MSDAAKIEIDLHAGALPGATLDDVVAPGGGECVFVGRTRRETHAEHGDLHELDYEAYEPMARAVLDALAREAVEKYGCHLVRIHHALGRVPVGAASVLVHTQCAHRAEAFDACRMLIDRLKHEVPIWKRERWSSSSTWVDGAVPPASGAGGTGA